MTSKAYGDPVYTVRLPRQIIAGLKRLAKDESTTTSVIVRDLVKAELDRRGYQVTEEPIPGQQSFA